MSRSPNKGRKASDSGYIDLHIHSSCSDSPLSPREVVRIASEKGLRAVAVTDHDSVAGVEEAIDEAAEYGIEVVSGVELSVSDGLSDIHILGYFVDHADEVFQRELEKFRVARFERVKKILAKLKELEVDIDLESVLKIADNGSIGRPHVAEALLDSGYVDTFEEAFRRYIGHRSPAYVPKMLLSSSDAFRLIERAGGVSVLAHPGTVQRDDLIPEFVELGMAGIEVWHPKHDRGTVRYYMELARRHGLVVTGGSDSHGSRTAHAGIGSERVPYSVLVSLREAAARSTASR
ncbi:MAG: PHP domain-containing protein [Candidatus Eiseniibacteriota bacterium]|nr:MAG: PHP domain-containing protein [Candidatus Eisenbacteria bacterium]